MRPPQSNEPPEMLREWAREIAVQQDRDKLTISGKGSGRYLRELFVNYLYAPTTERNARGPHLEFASARSDSELLAFIKKWGPITAVSTVNRGDGSKSARESLKKVRAVQLEFEAAVSLHRIIRADKPDLDAALKAMNQLADSQQSPGPAIECELIYGEAMRERSQLKGPNLREKCLDMLCAVVKRFPDTWIANKGGYVLLAPAAGHGVLPLLVFMLRQDVLNMRKIITCENCGQYLLQRRQGERACESCKGALRAKRHYNLHKKTILRRRREKRRLQKANAANESKRQV